VLFECTYISTLYGNINFSILFTVILMEQIYLFFNVRFSDFSFFVISLSSQFFVLSLFFGIAQSVWPLDFFLYFLSQITMVGSGIRRIIASIVENFNNIFEYGESLDLSLNF
jgi:hypothetical protein